MEAVCPFVLILSFPGPRKSNDRQRNQDEYTIKWRLSENNLLCTASSEELLPQLLP